MEHIKKFEEFESMVHSNTLAQLRKVSSMMNDTDIGKKVDDDSFANALETTKRDVTKGDIQTYSEYMDEPFSINQNRVPKK